MIIADYTLDHPVLRDARRDVPGIELDWEDSYTGPDGRMRVIAWLSCDDFPRLDAAMRDDPTVTDPVVLAEVGGRRLYRFELAGVGAETSIMPVVVDVGGVHQQLSADRGGWHHRTRFPSRAALERVYRFCLEHDIDFTFDRIYEQSDRYGRESPALTDAQYELLVEAVESGYLDIPRRSSLAELGERLGISRSAASERFRRGVKTLVQETVGR